MHESLIICVLEYCCFSVYFGVLRKLRCTLFHFKKAVFIWGSKLLFLLVVQVEKLCRLGNVRLVKNNFPARIVYVDGLIQFGLSLSVLAIVPKRIRAPRTQEMNSLKE